MGSGPRMDPTWLDVGGVRIRSPVTAGTNLALALQCAWYYTRLRGSSGAVERHWARFFAGMSVATLAGAAKHGLPHVLEAGAWASVLWTSSLAAGWAVFEAQRAMIYQAARGGHRVVLGRAAKAQLALLLGACLTLGPRIDLLIAHTVLGLLPVMLLEAKAAARARERRRHARIAAGLAVSFLSGVAYGLGASFGPWLTHVDIAHVFMALSYHLIASGFAGIKVPQQSILATRHEAVYL